MANEKNQGGALGKGLDALISKKYVVEEDSHNEVPKEDFNEIETANNPMLLNEEIVDGILAEIKKNPRISLWSAKSAAVLRYLRKTEPEFSISNEASILIEEAVKEKYPEIWALFEEHL